MDSAPLPDIVVFDLDGTLVDSIPGLTLAVNQVLAHLGRRALSADEVRGMVGEGLDMLLARGLAATGEALDPGSLRSLWFEVYGATVEEGTRPYPGAQALLDRLRDQGCRIGLCTNKPQAPTEQILATLGWRGRFGSVLGADAVPRRKPDPDHLLRVVAALGPGRAAYVGDSITDVQTAQAAGIPIVLVAHGYSNQDPASLGADVLVPDLGGVEAALRGLIQMS